MRTAAAFILWLPLLLMAGSRPSAETPRGSSYVAALNHACPAKRLDLLAPADLLDDVEAFPQSLPPRLGARLERSSDEVQRRCAHADGAACSNTETLRVIERLHLTRRFAARVCSAHLSCRAQSDCD